MKNTKKNTKKSSKPRAKKTLTRKEFTAIYRYLAEQITEIKKAVRALVKRARPIARSAEKLRDNGDKLYVAGKNKMLIPTFKTLPKMMEDLDIWASADYDIKLLIQSL
jgi:DNA-binding phage protein